MMACPIPYSSHKKTLNFSLKQSNKLKTSKRWQIQYIYFDIQLFSIYIIIYLFIVPEV